MQRHQHEARVCDRCIRKKVKCDQTRPSCSRCREAAVTCAYSFEKRRPGPAKGYRHPTNSKEAGKAPPAASVDRTHDYLAQKPIQAAAGSVLEALHWRPPKRKAPWKDVSVGSSRLPSGRPSFSISNKRLRVVEGSFRSILESFFHHVHPSIPLFDQQQLFRDFDNGSTDGQIFDVVAAITLVILRQQTEISQSNARGFLDHQLAITENPVSVNDGVTSLRDFQRACLLAYYAFHSYADRRAWFRITLLIRQAYCFGLHQLDGADPVLTFDERGDKDQHESWRRAWWVLFCLDSYCNIAAATPFTVESQSISTALKTMSHGPFPHASRSSKQSAVFLATEPALLWKTTQSLAHSDPTDHFSFHIMFTALIKEAATLHRLQAQRPSHRVTSGLQALEDTFASVRLALPSSYLTTTGLTLQDETEQQHHARLVNSMLFNASKLLHLGALILDQAVPVRPESWHQLLDCCADIVSVVKSFGPESFTHVDPALCLIVSAVLSYQYLYTKCQHDNQPEVQERLDRSSRVLLLFLERFAAHWYLPRFLLGKYTYRESFGRMQKLTSSSASHEQFCKSMPESLTFEEVQRLMRLYHGKLHQKWLHYADTRPWAKTATLQEDLMDVTDAAWLDTLDLADWGDMASLFDLPLLENV